jgi:hypothetical protein
MYRAPVLVLVFMIAVSAGALCQPHGHGWFVAGVRHLHYADAAGKVTSVQFSTGNIYGATMNWDNRTVLALDYTRSAILKIDPQQLAVVGTFFSDPSLSAATSVWDMAFDSNGDLFYSSTSPGKGVFKIATATMTLTSVHPVGTTGAANLSLDPLTGDLLVAPGNTAQTTVLRVSRDGSTATTVGTGFYTRYGTYRHPLTGDIFSGTCCTNGGGSNGSILYLKNGTSVASIFLASTVIRGGYAPQPERASAANPSLVVAVWRDTSVTGADGIWRVDIGTKAITKLATMATGNCYKPVPVFGRNLQTLWTGKGKWAARVSFPGHAGKPYVIAMSFSGLGALARLPDARYLPLIPDDLFRLSLTQSLAPFVTGNMGQLSSTAEGGANIDLSSLGKGVNGLLIFLVAVVVDPKAPLGIAEISDPATLVVEGL